MVCRMAGFYLKAHESGSNPKEMAGCIGRFANLSEHKVTYFTVAGQVHDGLYQGRLIQNYSGYFA